VVVPKNGWIRFESVTDKSKRLLVHTAKKGTNCVELVGFESEFAISHPCPPAKTMTQMIDFNLDEKLILRNVYKTAKMLVVEVEIEITPAAETVQTVAPEVVESPAEVVIEAPVASVG
jgi:hypothetical protein